MNLIELADRYCRHEFDILGSGWTRTYYGMKARGFEQKNYSFPWSKEEALKEIPADYLPWARKFLDKLPDGYEPIDWQIDIRSGYRFSAGIHHSKLQYGVIEGVDAKVSADLGRLYQLPVLAKAYKQSRNDKYRNELLAQLNDFLAFNAPEYGAAWRANMNVSIRAANIITALELIEVEISGELLEAVHAHGKFIFENLEFPETNFHPNHFIANISGLLMTAAIVKNKEWFDYAVKTIDEQIIYQSYPDGGNFEGATSYHCLVIEMLAYAMTHAAGHAGITTLEWMKKHLSENSICRFYRMFEATRDITMPDGRIPLIGDNDSGRFLMLEEPTEYKNDFRFILELGKEIFNSPELTREATSCALKDVGYYIMRDGQNALFINCGPIGTNGKGGHAHNDKLAFTMQLNALDIFIDPGIYVYTASRYYRELFRATGSHNTLQIKNYEQNRSGAESIWWGMCDDTQCELLEWTPFHFQGRHSGYCRYPDGAVHLRTIDWNRQDNSIIINDKLSRKSVGVICNFILHEEVMITAYTPSQITLRRNEVEVTLSAEHGYWLTEGAFVAHSYGVKTYTQKLVLHWENSESNTIAISYNITPCANLKNNSPPGACIWC